MFRHYYKGVPIVIGFNYHIMREKDDAKVCELSNCRAAFAEQVIVALETRRRIPKDATPRFFLDGHEKSMIMDRQKERGYKFAHASIYATVFDCPVEVKERIVKGLNAEASRRE